MHERGLTPLHRAVWTAVPASLEDFVQCVVAPLLVGGGVEPGGSV
jgi:hypothetical protein